MLRSVFSTRDQGSPGSLKPFLRRFPGSLFGVAPRSRGRKVALLGSMTLRGMGPSPPVQGATTAAVFEA